MRDFLATSDGLGFGEGVRMYRRRKTAARHARQKKVGGGFCGKTIEAQPVFGQTQSIRGRRRAVLLEMVRNMTMAIAGRRANDGDGEVELANEDSDFNDEVRAPIPSGRQRARS